MAAVTVPDETIAVNSQVYSFSEQSSLLWPVEGSVILGYNMDKTIYFPTLDIYRCNPAVVISAQVGEAVLSGAPGVVEEIYTDNEIGTVVKVSVGNGYEVIYGQLSNLQVGVSDHIEAGTVIGYIAEPTKYFTKEGTNLYLKLLKEGNSVDPMLYLIEK
jgi:murein DD-endopeptidase MepM/ murein hydrolase activator NlpD